MLLHVTTLATCQCAATVAARLWSLGPSVSTGFGRDWLTKLFEGSRKFIFIGLSLACGFQSVLGALGLYAYASDPVVTNNAG